jgi:anthranilate synthase/aminodeoxychorismate synthase-like glutamine amidotransferase
MVLVIDNFDSFTYNLVDYLHQLQEEVLVLRNDVPLSVIQAQAFDSILLSPGPCTPAESGILMRVIETYHLHKPILGICLGHQALGEFFGWQLTKALEPVHGKSTPIHHTMDPLFSGIPSPFPAMRYHSLILKERLTNELKVIATTNNDEIMAIRHQELPIVGLQFHPESILTYDGLRLLGNWFSALKS